jgi:hypothetical protein
MNSASITLEHLPNDLAQKIFEWAKDSAPLSELISYLLVCRTWRQIAEPVLWKNDLLRNGEVQSFVDAAEISKYGTPHVKNLSLALMMPFQ